MTKALHKLKREGVHLSAEVPGRLSPYLTSHVNRFGIYHSVAERLGVAVKRSGLRFSHPIQVLL